MSEFKFACPVCGQHITADPRASGTELACPTCFRKIVVPQAPASNSKLILAAAQAEKPRPMTEPTPGLEPVRRPGWTRFLPAVTTATLVCLAGAAGWRWGGRLIQRLRPDHPPAAPFTPERAAHPIPGHITWTMNLATAPIPDQPAAGSLRGEGFLCEGATLHGGTLTLRQGKGRAPDLGVSIFLFAQKAEDLSGKSISIGPERPPPRPAILVLWNDAQLLENREEITAGYALKLVFGKPAEGRLPGKLYLSLPDPHRSVIAGAFEAQIHKLN